MTQFPPEAANWRDFNLDAEQLWRVLEKIQPFDPAEGVRGFYRLYATNQGTLRRKDPYLRCSHSIHRAIASGSAFRSHLSRRKSYWQRAPKRLEEHKARLDKDGVVLVSHEQRLQQQLLTTKPPQTSRSFAGSGKWPTPNKPTS
jgi:hypothetical protein